MLFDNIWIQQFFRNCVSGLSCTPPRLIWLIGCQQSNYQSYQLASSENHSSLVLVLSHLIILTFIESSIISITHPDRISCFTKVVAQISIASASELGFISPEVSRLMPTPFEASILSHLCLVTIEVLDVTNLSYDPC